MNHSSVLIVGASYGGLTLARFLRTYGVDCVVLESRETLLQKRDRGCGLWNKAQDILTHPSLGLAAEFRDIALGIRPAAYRNRAGDWLSLASDSPGNRSRVATISENRLLQMLASPSARDTHASVDSALPCDWLRLGARVAHVSSDDSHVRVTCADGSIHTSSVLIGADGVGSLVRRLAFPERPALECDAVSWGATLHNFPFTNHSSAGAMHANIAPLQAFETLGRSRRFAAVPLRDQSMFWFATVPTKDAPLPNTPLAEVKKWLAHSAFPASEWHAPIADMIAHTPAEALEARAVPRPSLFERAHAPSESAARIALIGDASHPIACNLAQGAAIAIEDAYCLAAELIPLFSAQQPIGSNPSHDAVRVAIATFDSARSRRVASNRAVTYFTAALSAPRSDLGETLRDLPLRMTMRLSAPLNAAVFDASLSVSLGGESYRLPSLPQL